MLDANRFKLLRGPYHAPRCLLGRRLYCELRGWVFVAKMSDARIPWPMCKAGKRARAFVLTGDLVRAVVRESNQAVCHWWGVTPQTVTAWRKVLDVPPINTGTARLYREYAPERLTPEVRLRAAKALGGRAVREKIAASRRGKPRPVFVIEALRRANRGRPLSAEHRAKLSAINRRRGIRPPWLPPPWRKSEDRLLGRLPDAEVARRTGRTVTAVRCRRAALRIPSKSGKGPKMRSPRDA